MRRLAAAIGLAACVVAAPAAADGIGNTLAAFGILGTWSPDCAGPIRVIYAAPPGAAPTSSAVIDGREQAVAEIRDVVQLDAFRIRWTSVYREYLPLDVGPQPWMPMPGEAWETVLEKVGDKIRSMQSQRVDGGKVLVRDGFYYSADDTVPGRPIIWRRTEQTTPLFGRCADSAAAAPPR